MANASHALFGNETDDRRRANAFWNETGQSTRKLPLHNFTFPQTTKKAAVEQLRRCRQFVRRLMDFLGGRASKRRPKLLSCRRCAGS